MSSDIISYFKWDHLPPHLQAISKHVGELAERMEEVLQPGAEKAAGLRKLLEAKDCFVRASLSGIRMPDAKTDTSVKNLDLGRLGAQVRNHTTTDNAALVDTVGQDANADPSERGLEKLRDAAKEIFGEPPLKK